MFQRGAPRSPARGGPPRRTGVARRSARRTGARGAGGGWASVAAALADRQPPRGALRRPGGRRGVRCGPRHVRPSAAGGDGAAPADGSHPSPGAGHAPARWSSMAESSASTVGGPCWSEALEPGSRPSPPSPGSKVGWWAATTARLLAPGPPPTAEPTYPTMRLTLDSLQMLDIDPTASAPIAGKVRITSHGTDVFRPEPVELRVIAILVPAPVGGGCPPSRPSMVSTPTPSCSVPPSTSTSPCRTSPGPWTTSEASWTATTVGRLTVPRGRAGLSAAERLLASAVVGAASMRDRGSPSHEGATDRQDPAARRRRPVPPPGQDARQDERDQGDGGRRDRRPHAAPVGGSPAAPASRDGRKFDVERGDPGRAPRSTRGWASSPWPPRACDDR